MLVFNTFWNIFLFNLALFIFAISPGYIFLKISNVKLSFLENLILSFGVGIAFTCCLYFITGFLKIWILADFIIAVSFIFLIFKFIHYFYTLIKLNDSKNTAYLLYSLSSNNYLEKFKSVIPIILIIFFCSLLQSSLIFGGGYNASEGTIKFSQTGDAMWLVSLSRELSKNIPPIHPGFAPEIVTNYHYFTHLFMGIIYRFTQNSLLNLYYNYFSFFWCVFIGFSAFILGRKIFNNNFFALLLVVFTYTAGSFSYLLPLWLGKSFQWNDSTFWVSQTFNLILNPSVMLSLSLFYLILFCLYIYWEEKNNKIILPLVLLAGSLISYKVYAGVLIFISFGIIALFDLYKRKTVSILVFGGILALSSLIFLPVSGKDSASFMVYAPFWFLHTMVENPDRLNIPNWALKEQYYWSTNNIFAVIRLRLLELIIFIAGNLGPRIMSFLIFPLLIIKKIKPTHFTYFLIFAYLFGMLIPLFFIQRGSVGNTIQFFYYSLIIGNIFTIFILQKLFMHRTKMVIVISTLLIISGLPTTLKTLLTKGKPFILPKNQVEALLFLKNKTPKDEIILLPPTASNLDSMYVSAVSERNTFYSHKLMAENTLKDYQFRESQLNQFFFPKTKKQGIKFQKNFILKYNLTTMYLLRDELSYLKNILIPYKIIYKNSLNYIIRFL